MKMHDPENILIIKLSAIGDVVHSLPLLEVIRKNFTQSKIDWLVEEDASQIIVGHPYLDHVIVSLRNSWQKRLLKGNGRSLVIQELISFLKELRGTEYDLIIDLQGLFKSGILTALSKGKRKIGMSGSREGGRLFLNERPVPVDYEQHAVDRYLKVADYLDCKAVKWKGKIPIFESDKKLVNELLGTEVAQERPIVAINPMAKWKTKLWEPERFAVLADRLKDELSCEIMFTGSKGDQAIVEDILGKMKIRSLSLAGRTSLKELAYLYTNCRAFVTTDTGPMHIAAAMGCPVIALFGPTAPWRTGPYGQGHKIVREEIDCSPCFKKRCGHMSCMKKITVDRVFDAVREALVENV